MDIQLIKKLIKKEAEKREIVAEFERQEREYKSKKKFKDKLANAKNQDEILDLIEYAYEAGRNYMDCHWSDFYEDFVRKVMEKAKEQKFELEKYISDITY